MPEGRLRQDWGDAVGGVRMRSKPQENVQRELCRSVAAKVLNQLVRDFISLLAEPEDNVGAGGGSSSHRQTAPDMGEDPTAGNQGSGGSTEVLRSDSSSWSLRGRLSQLRRWFKDEGGTCWQLW